MRSEINPTITLSATPKGNGYQATVTFPDGVSMSSAETYPTVAEAMTAAARKLLDMSDRLTALGDTVPAIRRTTLRAAIGHRSLKHFDNRRRANTEKRFWGEGLPPGRRRRRRHTPFCRRSPQRPPRGRVRTKFPVTG